MKKFRILIITSRRMCISTMLQCIHLCITLYICKVLIKNIFGGGLKLHTVLLYVDSIFTIQDFTSSKTD